MTMNNLLQYRADMEHGMRQLIGRAIMVTEIDLFALPCGCSGLTANTRGLLVDDLEIFENHLLKLLQNIAQSLDIPSTFVFARIIPGTQEIASLNMRNLCPRCYSDFSSATGKRPRPDIYILQFKKRKR